MGGEADAPLAEGVASSRLLVRSVSAVFGERAPVCHYPIAHRARARAHRTGFTWSGESVAGATRTLPLLPFPAEASLWMLALCGQSLCPRPHP